MNVDVFTANNLPSPDSLGPGGIIYDGTQLRVSDGDAWSDSRNVPSGSTLTVAGTAALTGTITIGGTTLTSTASELNKSHSVNATAYLTVTEELTFTETSGAGTYTGTIALPAGARIIDIGCDGQVLWNSAGACALKVGDGSDDDGFFTSTDLKATDLLAGEINNLEHPGGKAGAYIASEQRNLYSATARNVIAVVTQASGTGTLGRTRVYVTYAVPTAVAATKA